MSVKTMGSSVALAAALACGAGVAEADTTMVRPPASGEASHAGIFSRVYGGTFVADGLDYTNGAVTAERLDDQNDRVFNMDGFTASAKAVFAMYDQAFGYRAGEHGGSFTKLFDISGSGFAVHGDAGATPVAGSFRFARGGKSGAQATSNPADNAGTDHLVSYQIHGLNADLPVLDLFWEDMSPAAADDDFNDLVVEVRGVDVAPTPAALGAGLVMLGGLLLRRRPSRA